MDSFTRLPNNFFDLELNPYQFMIISFIVRKTDGWCKTEDGISISQFVDTLGISKNKVISTLKELSERDLIIKKHQKNDNGGNSFNSYSISPTLVHEINKGSASQVQGVVHERDKQKKANTKETKTTNYERFLSEIKSRVPHKSKVTKYLLNSGVQEINDFQ